LFCLFPRQDNYQDQKFIGLRGKSVGKVFKIKSELT